MSFSFLRYFDLPLFIARSQYTSSVSIGFFYNNLINSISNYFINIIGMFFSSFQLSMHYDTDKTF
jgi:hypothetical protein